MNKKELILLISVILVSCFSFGLILIPRGVITNNTIMSEIWSLEKDLRIEEKIKTYYETQMSYMDKDLANTELDEHERLMSFVKKKDLEQSLKESEQKIENLTKKINKRYKWLRNRNPEFKRACKE